MADNSRLAPPKCPLCGQMKSYVGNCPTTGIWKFACVSSTCPAARIAELLDKGYQGPGTRQPRLRAFKELLHDRW